MERQTDREIDKDGCEVYSIPAVSYFDYDYPSQTSLKGKSSMQRQTEQFIRHILLRISKNKYE